MLGLLSSQIETKFVKAYKMIKFENSKIVRFRTEINVENWTIYFN